MKRSRKNLLRPRLSWRSLCLGVGIGLLCPAISVAEQPGMQALVVDDLGGYAGILAKMGAYEWEVTTISTLELIKGGAVALRDYDVVWIPAQSNYPALRRLVEKKSPLDGFVRAGGVLVIMALSPDGFWIDATLGGADGKPLPAGGAGAVSIAAPDHPMISGVGTGGVPLNDGDLDPEVTGGRGNIVNLPQDTSVVVIANNDAGCVVAVCQHGAGHVFMSTLQQEEDVCKANVLLYIQSIAE